MAFRSFMVGVTAYFILSFTNARVFPSTGLLADGRYILSSRTMKELLGVQHSMSRSIKSNAFQIFVQSNVVGTTNWYLEPQDRRLGDCRPTKE